MTNKVQYETVNGRTVKITEIVDGENIAVPAAVQPKASAAKTETAAATSGAAKKE